jgi:hypothetical protein
VTAVAEALAPGTDAHLVGDGTKLKGVVLNAPKTREANLKHKRRDADEIVDRKLRR